MHDATPVRHLIFIGILIGAVVVDGVDQSQVQNHAVQSLHNTTTGWFSIVSKGAMFCLQLYKKAIAFKFERNSLQKSFMAFYFNGLSCFYKKNIANTV